MTLERYKPKSQPKGWQEHNDKRRALRRGTYEAIAALGRKRCSTITTADLRRLMTTMDKEGLSVSTIQKEIALLKALFNISINEWKWVGFETPAQTLKLGKSESRFICITAEQEQALWNAADRIRRAVPVGQQRSARCGGHAEPGTDRLTAHRGTMNFQDCCAMLDPERARAHLA